MNAAAPTVGRMMKIGDAAMMTVLFVAASGGAMRGEDGPQHFAQDVLAGTLARDHQTRAIFHAGKHRRTYVAYLDDAFDARVTFYDHDTARWAEPVRVDTCIAETGGAKGVKDGHNSPNIWVTQAGTILLFYGSRKLTVAVLAAALGFYLERRPKRLAEDLSKEIFPD